MNKTMPQVQEYFHCAGNPEDTIEVNTFTRVFPASTGDAVTVLALEMQIAHHPEDEDEHCILLSYADTVRLHALLGRIVAGDDK